MQRARSRGGVWSSRQTVGLVCTGLWVQPHTTFLPQEVETGELEAQGYPRLHCEMKASLHEILSQNNNENLLKQTYEKMRKESCVISKIKLLSFILFQASVCVSLGEYTSVYGVGMCMGVRAYVCTCGQRTEVSVGYPSPLLSLTQPETH